jgi:hypothetical protein
MIWLTWRQFRMQAVAGLIVLAVVVAFYAATGPGLVHLADTTGFGSCTGGCEDVTRAFRDEAMAGLTGKLYYAAGAILFLAPALIGVFWGAPLIAREFEQGTQRLVWNQSVSRGRWLAVKLAGAGLAAMAMAGLISLAVTWWAADLDRARDPRIQPLIYATRGVVPIGYAALAFMLGVTVGVLLRRTIPAMAITLVLVVAAQLAAPFVLREHLTTPIVTTAPLSGDTIDHLMMHSSGVMDVYGDAPDDTSWVIRNDTLTVTGQVFRGPVNWTACGPQADRSACPRWLDSQHLRQRLSYIPDNRFWALQWRELGVLVAISLALAAFCGWWIRRRVN